VAGGANRDGWGGIGGMDRNLVAERKKRVHVCRILKKMVIFDRYGRTLFSYPVLQADLRLLRFL
ncbi:MAG: hypothetical protein K2O82_00335, partial [Alistipes sp.]|nr:hypothetical protein [Alistipes sp.]